MLKRFAVLMALVALVAGLFLPALASAQSAPPSSIIVKLVAGLPDQAQVDVVASNGGILRSSIPALRLYVIDVPAADLAGTLARYQADPRVERAEENKVRISESVPGDPLYADQWALPRIGWDQVFGTVTPTGTAKVAILDTGVDALHPELAGMLVPGTSILDGSNGTTDPSGHGTWLAGIIAAQTGGTSPDGIAGVAYDGVRIMPVTVLNASGEGLDSDVIAGVVWAVDHGADVILMAFSNPGFSPALQEAIDYAWSRGVVLVAAAGNGATNAPTFPAGDRGVMGVAATDQNDAQASFSNEGEAVFIAAPGTDIQTTGSGDAYAVISGTSAAAAHVAGLAAFMKAVDPTLPNGVIVFRIASTADPAGTQIQTGNGRINMARALASTATDSIQPAGAAPLAEGGPFVGPYRADGNQTVSGIVRDANTNDPIPGATLSCPAANGCNGSNTTLSAANGTYSLALQFPGNSATISITASKVGYVTQTSPPFAISNTVPVTNKNFLLVPANTPPTISRDNASVTANEGATASNSGTWSDANTGDSVTLTASVGTVSKSGTNAAGTWSWSFTTTDGPAQSQTVTITANDGIGGVATTTFSLTVSNVPPTAAITGAPASSPEGTTINLGSTVTDPSSEDTAFGFTRSWSVTKNGSPFASGSSASLTFTPDDNGIYVVTLSATDKDNGVGTASSTITVTNVPPTATITGAPASSPEGTAISLGSTVADPSSLDTAAGFTMAWTATKNGSPFASGSGASLSFTPDDNGTYVVTFSATDKDGGVGTDSKTITVTNVPPTAAITGAPASSPEGTAISLGSTVTDPSAADTTLGFTVAWSVEKNGSSFASASGVNFSFTPDDNGTYVVTLSATDKDGGVGTDSKTITVTNVPPTATITGAPASSPEGTAITLGSTVTDPSPVDTAAGFTRSWSVTKNGSSFASGSGANLSFTPDDNGTYVVTFSATDKDGGVGTDGKTITVTNVPPTAAITGAPASSPEGTAISLGSTVTDPSPLDTAAGFTRSWSVTKNGAPFGSTGSGASFSFTPDDNGIYVVTFSATDKDGGGGTDSKTINVTNVAPTITAVTPSSTSVLVGETVTFTGTATDPSSADTAAGLQWSWNGGAGFGPFGSNTFPTSYGVCGSYTVAAMARDKDGGVSTSFTSTAVTVWNGNFLEPLREGTSNQVQKGRVVPVKINFGCGGHSSGLAPAIQLLNGDFVSSAGTESTSNYIDTLSVSNADTTGIMREVDSKYMYNLAIPNNSGWTAGKPLTIRVSPFGNGTSPVMYILLEIRK